MFLCSYNRWEGYEREAWDEEDEVAEDYERKKGTESENTPLFTRSLGREEGEVADDYRRKEGIKDLTRRSFLFV